MTIALTFLLGAALGGLALYLFGRSRAGALLARADELEASLTAATGRADALARLEPELAAARERLAVQAELERQLDERFKALSAEAVKQLRDQAREDLETRHKAVEQVVKPLRESLEKVDRQAQALEQSRRQAYGALDQQVKSLLESQERLRSETGNLVTALRTPHVRGRWGEQTLKRVVEMAGMIAHCDFVEQGTVTDADGRTLRPDLVVRLPGGKNVVVDAKAPLAAYLDMLEARDDATRVARLADHARQVRDHIHKLSGKRYWQQFEPAPDFVVMFLPDEGFFRAALEHDPSLIEAGIDVGVLPASPTTLITLLRAVAYGWQQETVAQSAREVHALACELYERLATMGNHVGKLGRSLNGAVAAYNDAVGSLESRVLVTARKLSDHGVGDGALPELAPLDRQSRPLQAPELADGQSTLVELPSASADAA